MPGSRPASARRSIAASVRRWLWRRTVQIGNRTAGLPIALRAIVESGPAPDRVIRAAFAREFWTKGAPSGLMDLALALVLWPAIVVGLAVWLTSRNGAIVARRTGRPAARQFLDQLRLYAAAGALPPWYYAFDLFERPRGSAARGFIYRCESKGGILALLKERRPPRSIVSDKVIFAEHCRRCSVPTIPVIAAARNGRVDWAGDEDDLRRDWFVKPIDGKGGRGIERWDYDGDDRFRGAGGETVQRAELVKRIAARSVDRPLFVQPRIASHPELQDLSNGALSTVRALTCLNEHGEPELHGAVLRMAVGGNHVVDNFHAGGIAAAIDLETGLLGPASNLGVDARLGWLDAHPDSGAVIRGRRFPRWEEFAPFVQRAHRAFADRFVIGWDVAMTAEGLLVVEANGSPDLDIMQRIARRGLMPERFAVLLAHHLRSTAGTGSALQGSAR